MCRLRCVLNSSYTPQYCCYNVVEETSTSSARRKLSASNVAKEALESLLPDVSSERIAIDADANLICIEALNNTHANFLLGMGNNTQVLGILKTLLGITDAVINTYLTTNELMERVCSDECTGNNDNDSCDDGGSGSQFSICQLGTDCSDCNDRYT